MLLIYSLLAFGFLVLVLESFPWAMARHRAHQTRIKIEREMAAFADALNSLSGAMSDAAFALKGFDDVVRSTFHDFYARSEAKHTLKGRSRHE